MVRFIDLRKQGTGYRFAFWNTSTNTFESWDGEQAWDTFRDFEQAINHDGRDPNFLYEKERRKNLLPDWAFIPPTEEEQEENV